MLDNPVIVSDEEILPGDGSYVLQKGKIYSNKMKSFFGADLTDCQKIIAQFHQIDWNGLESEFGYIDVEKLASEKYPNWFTEYDEGRVYRGYIQGFKKAQELTDKKFSLEDIEKAFYAKDNASYKEEQIFLEEFIQSISQPKVFSIEAEMECGEERQCECINNQNCLLSRLKITNGKIKITKKL